MLISFNWLKQYLQLSSGVTPEQVAERLKLSTVEVEKVERLGANNDAILEIDNKSLSHRPDLWGHYGLAREVGALFKTTLKEYSVSRFKKGSGFDLRVKVVALKLCPRYMAVAIEGVVICESPAWLKQRLLAVGLRPINNVVDITNFVMLDLGQPMHAFDAARLNSKQIIVRLAKNGEEFITLDGQRNKLDSSALVIADEKQVIALAGVMGGEASGVNEQTKTIIFESANFDAASIRQTSIKFGLRTESSARFEKGLDPTLCELALQKVVELVLEICSSAKVVCNIVDEAHWHLNRGTIELSMEFLRRKLGVEIKQKEVVEILKNLGFGVKIKKDVLYVTAPSWRAGKDIVMAEDLVEEIARIYGFANIPSQLPIFPIAPPEENKLRNLERRVAETLIKELGYAEVYNYSFVSAEQVTNLGDDLSKYIELDNPLSKEKPFLRRYLLPNLLENIKNNLENYSELKIFEIGKVFSAGETGVRAETNSDELLPRQDTWLEAVYVKKKDNAPFWQARRAAEIIFQSLNLEWKAAPPDKVCAWEHPTRLALAEHNGKVVGVIHELNPLTAGSFGIESRVGVLKINLSKLAEVVKEKVDVYKKVSVYPEMTRDIAFLVKKEISHAEIVKALSRADTLLKKVELFDVYAGDKLGADKKSMAYHLVYNHPGRTLTTEEVNKAHDKVKAALKSKFGAEIRE